MPDGVGVRVEEHVDLSPDRLQPAALRVKGELLLYDAREVRGAGGGLRHGGGVNDEHDARVEPPRPVLLEVRRDVDDEGVLSEVHGGLHFAVRYELRPLEVGRHDSRGDFPRDG